jgi:hypothetical protein
MRVGGVSLIEFGLCEDLLGHMHVITATDFT